MLAPEINPAKIRALPWMDPTAKALFRRLIRSKFQQKSYVSLPEITRIADYVCLCGRIEDLRLRMAGEMAAESPTEADKQRLLTMGARLDSMISLRIRLGDSL